MSLPPLVDAYYVEVTISNLTGKADPYVYLVTEAQAYKLVQHQNTAGKKVYVAEPDNPSGFVAGARVSTIINELDNKIAFYLKVFDGSPIAYKSGRIYFADQKDALPWPGGIAPNAPFDFDFIEFTVDPALNQLNVDTTQVDQMGMPIFLQFVPVASDYPSGTGIVFSQSRAALIDAFKHYTANPIYQAYAGVFNPAITRREGRLLAPQHVIDGSPSGSSGVALGKSFDLALYLLFYYYYVKGGRHVLYLVGNGDNGPEIFAGSVVDDFVVQDRDGQDAKYLVFQFKGTGFAYQGEGAAPTRVGTWGGAIYQIFYPYFTENAPSSHNKDLAYSLPKAPYWFGGFAGNDERYNLPITSAGRMVLGGSGVFADDVEQKQYYLKNGGLPANFDHKMLGNLENQLCTMLNRGITPDTHNPAMPSNLHLRIGSNQATDLIHVDLSQLQEYSLPPTTGAIGGAVMSYKEDIMVPGGQKVWWNSLTGYIHFQGKKVQTFKVDPANVANPFVLDPQNPVSDNYVQSADFVFDGDTVSQVNFNWQSAVGIETGEVGFDYQYGPATKQAHYATLRLFSPYGQAIPYQSGDLGPASNFSNGLVGAIAPDSETSGMTMTGVSLNDPTYVYRAERDCGHITIYSPQQIKPINTNILAFSRFYPLSEENTPYGQWNAYSAFFHIGDPANGVQAPTVDGRGYAFSFDDNGGYSSDITVQLPSSSQPQMPVVATTLNLFLLPW